MKNRCKKRRAGTKRRIWPYLLGLALPLVSAACILVLLENAYCEELSNNGAKDFSTSCIASPTELAGWGDTQRTSSKSAVIDTRGQQPTVTIPDTLNMPLFSIKSKGYLQPKQILIFGRAHEMRGLVEGCNELVKAGFRSVKVALGGVEALHQAGFKIAGPPSTLAQERIISSQQFIYEHSFAPWRVIRVGTTASLKDSNSALPLATDLSISYSGKVAELYKKIDKSLRPDLTEQDSLFAIVITDTELPALEYEALAEMFVKNDLPRTFILGSQRDGLEKYLDECRQISSSREKAEEQRGRVAQCQALR